MALSKVQLLLMLLAALCAAGCRQQDSTPTAEIPAPGAAALPVDARPVERVAGCEVLESHAGRVVSRRTSTLGFERGGRVERVSVDSGDSIEQGQPLATLDTRGLSAERRQLAAQVAETEALLTIAHLTADRLRSLHVGGHVSAQERDQAVQSEQALTARLEASRAAREAVDIDLDLAVIRAPYAGTVISRMVDEGTVVTAGAPILRVIESRAREAHVGMPPQVAATLTRGGRYGVEVEGRSIGAVLRTVLASIETETRTVTAIFDLDTADTAVLDGAVARVTLPRRIATEGFWLPLGALAESRRGLWAAFVVVPDGHARDALRVERRQLELLHNEADRALVRGTLRDGEYVVVSGAHRLVAGQRVRVAENDATDQTTTSPRLR